MAEFAVQVNNSVYWNHTDSDLAGRDAVDANSIAYSKTLTRGVGAGQADQVFHRRLVIPSGTMQSLKLSDGSLTDRLGNAVVMDRMKLFQCVSLWTSDAIACHVGFEASPLAAWFSLPGVYLPLRSDGYLSFGSAGATGFPVTPGVEDSLTFEAVGGDATVDVVIIGASA